MAGAIFTHDSDGALTIAGLGDGYDESLTLNLDDTENTAVLLSSTGVTQLTLSSLGLYADYLTLPSAQNPYMKLDETDGTDWCLGIDDVGNSIELRTSTTVGSSVKLEVDESGNVTTTGDLAVSGDQITMPVSTSGITHTGATSLTIKSNTGGIINDAKGTVTIKVNGEDIVFTGTENTVTESSSTGVTTHSFGSINTATAGTATASSFIQATAETVTTGGITLTASQSRNNHTVVVTAASTITLQPAATTGYGARVTIYVRDASEEVKVDPSGSEKMCLNGTALDAGFMIKSASGAGDFIELEATTDADGSGTDGYRTLGRSGTWATNGS
jgi:hypothetical protein